MLVDLDEDQVEFLKVIGGINNDISLGRPTKAPEGWDEGRMLAALVRLLPKLHKPMDREACMDRLNQLSGKIIDKSEGKTSVDDSYLDPEERNEYRALRAELTMGGEKRTDLIEGYAYYRANSAVRDSENCTSYTEEFQAMARQLAERMTDEELAAYLKEHEDEN